MNDRTPQPGKSDDWPGAGLCATCAHAQRRHERRGSTFYAVPAVVATDPRFPRYPAAAGGRAVPATSRAPRAGWQ